MIPRSCLDCGIITKATRCDACRKTYERTKSQQRAPRPHYSGDYKARAKVVRENATTCWLCGEGARVDDQWQADHLLPADPYSPLLPAHRSCNISRANKMRKK